MLGITGPVALSSLPVWWATEMLSALSELEFHQLTTNLVALPALCQPLLPEVMKQESIPCSVDAML